MANVVQLHSLDSIMAYKGIWALSRLSEDSHIRQAVYYACCLISGSSPVWGVWTVRGVFVRFYGLRGDIEADYKSLVWVRKMATWKLAGDIGDLDIGERRHELEKTYKSPIPKTA